MEKRGSHRNHDLISHLALFHKLPPPTKKTTTLVPKESLCKQNLNALQPLSPPLYINNIYNLWQFLTFLNACLISEMLHEVLQMKTSIYIFIPHWKVQNVHFPFLNKQKQTNKKRKTAQTHADRFYCDFIHHSAFYLPFITAQYYSLKKKIRKQAL